MALVFKPRKNLIGQIDVSRIRFQLIDEYTCVQRDPAMTMQERSELLQTQPRRSFSR